MYFLQPVVAIKAGLLVLLAVFGSVAQNVLEREFWLHEGLNEVYL